MKSAFSAIESIEATDIGSDEHKPSYSVPLPPLFPPSLDLPPQALLKLLVRLFD